jgi:SAM-dependent methyltransferase
VLFGLSTLTPFSFVDPIEEFRPRHDRYDLIVMYEGLTHSRDPRAVIRWLRSHLEPGGVAVLLREPNTPQYRRYFPLSVVFNNFHYGLFTEATIRRLIESEGLACEFHDERHDSFPDPLYLNVIIRDGGERSATGRRVEAPVREEFYRSWVREENNRIVQSIVNTRRGLNHLFGPVVRAIGKRLMSAIGS